MHFVPKQKGLRMAKVSKHRFAVILLCTGIIALAGCANLTAVRDFSNISAATADYQQIVADYAGEPAREKLYTPIKDAAQLDAESAERQKQQAWLLADQQILVNYMAALGSLAAGDSPDTSAQYTSLQKAVTDLPVFPKADQTKVKANAEAAASIASMLTNLVLEIWREDQIKQIVRQTEPNIQALISGLKDIVDKDFAQTAQDEDRRLQGYFGDVRVEQESIRSAVLAAAKQGAPEVKPSADPPIATSMLGEREQQVQTRKDRIAKYGAVLDKIAEGHADLAKNIDKLSDKDLQSRLRDYAGQLNTLYSDIKTLKN